MDIAQITRYKTIKLYGLNPEAVEAVIQKKINELEGVNYVIELHDGRIHIVLSASANSEEEAKETIKPMYTFLKKELGEFIYSTRKEDTLEAIVVKLLEKYELTVSTTESCTGGLLAARFINVAGVSEVYKEGFITYTNKSKRKRLNVDKQTLKKYGAVSKQTAKEMVMGLVMQTDSDCGLAVTGIAGPDGGTIEKPVGLVYIACFVKNTTVVKKYNFDQIPVIYELDPLTMEKINGENIYKANLDTEQKKQVIDNLISSLEKLHGFAKTEADSYSIMDTYFFKTFGRLDKIRNLVPFALEKTININGKDYKNPFFYRERIKADVRSMCLDTCKVSCKRKRLL